MRDHAYQQLHDPENPEYRLGIRIIRTYITEIDGLTKEDEVIENPANREPRCRNQDRMAIEESIS